MLTDKDAQEKYYGDNILDFGKGKQPDIPIPAFGGLLDLKDYNEKLTWITDQITDKYKCYLYGVDCLIDNNNGNFYIIDFNAIPSFRIIKDMRSIWMRFLRQTIKEEIVEDVKEKVIVEEVLADGVVIEEGIIEEDVVEEVIVKADIAEGEVVLEV